PKARPISHLVWAPDIPGAYEPISPLPPPIAETSTPPRRLMWVYSRGHGSLDRACLRLFAVSSGSAGLGARRERPPFLNRPGCGGERDMGRDVVGRRRGRTQRV